MALLRRSTLSVEQTQLLIPLTEYIVKGTMDRMKQAYFDFEEAIELRVREMVMNPLRLDQPAAGSRVPRTQGQGVGRANPGQERSSKQSTSVTQAEEDEDEDEGPKGPIRLPRK